MVYIFYFLCYTHHRRMEEMKIVIVDEKTFLEDPEFWVKTMREFNAEQTAEKMLGTIRRNCFFCFAFNDDGEVVSWSRSAKTYGRKTMYCLRHIFTKPEFRGKGYAGLCFKATEDYITKNDISITKIYTFVDNDNESSIKFHEKMGYKRVKKPSKYLVDMHGWDSAIMFEKHIDRNLEKER